MEYTKEQIEMIMNFGALQYKPLKMSILFELDMEVISSLMLDKKSEFYKIYQKGKEISEYKIDLKLHELALKGDIKALEKFNQRR